MTNKELEKRIEDLERQIAELLLKEALRQPIYVLPSQPVYYPLPSILPDPPFYKDKFICTAAKIE